MTIKEATERWTNEFNAIPQVLIQKAYPDMEGIEVLATKHACGNCGGYNLNDVGDGSGMCERCGFVDVYDVDCLPMWGTMWTFGDSLDDDWVKENLETMRQCGVYVYESEELGVFIGIDGAGYDFYEAHWIPLYKARGLQWHDA